MSTLGELYRKIFFNDKTCIQFLKDCELLPNTKLCTKLNSIGEQCGSEMKETFKKSQKRDLNRDVIVTKYLRHSFFIVDKRDREILLPIIIQEIEPEITIYSDEWRAYNSCTGAQTQTIECLWKHMKVKYEIRDREATNLLEDNCKKSGGDPSIKKIFLNVFTRYKKKHFCKKLKKYEQLLTNRLFKMGQLSTSRLLSRLVTQVCRFVYMVFLVDSIGHVYIDLCRYHFFGR